MTRYSKTVELDAEQMLVSAVKSFGGMALKLKFVGLAGAPDRVLLLPGGKFYLVELKDVGGKLEASQKVLFPKIEKLGFPIHVLVGEAGVAAFIRKELYCGL